MLKHYPSACDLTQTDMIIAVMLYNTISQTPNIVHLPYVLYDSYRFGQDIVWIAFYRSSLLFKKVFKVMFTNVVMLVRFIARFYFAEYYARIAEIHSALQEKMGIKYS